MRTGDLRAIAPLVLAAVFVAAGGVLYWFHQTAPFDLSGNGCVVVAYHRIVPYPGVLISLLDGLDDYTLYRDDFQEQIRSLKAWGVHFITPEQLESFIKRRTRPPEKCVLITLDDADISQYRYAFPILKQEQVPFALFVISGQVGARSFKGLEMSTWLQIREMAASGLATLGSHTNDMHVLDGAGEPLFTRRENTKRFADDLRSSIARIQQETGVAPRYFAYPYGFGTPETDEAALRLGMRLLFTLKPGMARPGDPAFFVKRIMVTSRNWRRVTRWATAGLPNAGLQPAN